MSIGSELSVGQKSPDLIENLKTSADFTFSFWTIETKRKGGIGGISRKATFMRIKLD